MAFKFAVLATLLAAVHAGIITAPAATSYSSSAVSHGSTLSYTAPVAHLSYAAPVAYATPIHKTIVTEQDAPAHYDFEYSVQDPHTGDIKSQKESRQGDVVHGSYSLVEADGSRRVVEYTADGHTGFNAVVHREPAAHPVAVKAVAPVLKYSTPITHIAHVAPVAHIAHIATPVTHISHIATPVVHYSAAPSISYTTYAAPTLYHH